MKIISEKKNKLLKTSLIFLIINSLVSYIIGYKFLKYTGSIEGVTDFIYLSIVSISHLFVLTNISGLITLPLCLITTNKKIIKFVSISLCIASLFILYADAIAFEQYRFHINKFVLNLIIKGGKGVFHFDTIMYLIMAGTIAMITTIEYFLYKLSEKLSTRNIKKTLKYVYITIGLLYVISNFMYAGASAYYFNPITKHYRLYPLYFPLTANSLLREYIVDEDKARENLEHTDISKTALNYPRKTIITKDSITKKNILFIFIDAWRADCIGQNISPNIYSLKGHSKNFENHYSGSNGTRGGVFSIFYGLPSIYWDNMKANCISPVIINTLQKDNYEFGIFSTATLLAPAFDKTVFSNLKNIETNTHGNSPSEGDAIITNKFNDFVNKLDKKNDNNPFFGFLFYDSAHGYDYPKDFKTKFNPTLDAVNYLKLNNDYDRTKFFNRYKNGINYIDSLIGSVIKNLKEKDLLKNTTIVITGDHGQEFNDNHKNYWGHGSNFSKYQIKVPLLIYDQTYTAESFKHKTSHYDVAPTIMNNILHCKNKASDYSIGKDLFEKKSWNYLISGSYMNFGILSDNQIITKYINGDFTITDLKLNELSTNKINYTKLSHIMKEINSFYQK